MATLFVWVGESREGDIDKELFEFEGFLWLSVTTFWQIRLNVYFSNRYPEFHSRLAWFIPCHQSKSQQLKGPCLVLSG